MYNELTSITGVGVDSFLKISDKKIDVAVADDNNRQISEQPPYCK